MYSSGTIFFFLSHYSLKCRFYHFSKIFLSTCDQVIREGCISLVDITDMIVCDFLDPLVLQPASLDVATVKKKPEEDVVIIGSHSVSNSFDGIDLWLQVSPL